MSTKDNSPRWVTEKPTIHGNVVYTATGEGSTLEESKSNAIRSSLSQMSLDLGYDLTDSCYRELISFNHISEFDAALTREYSKEEDGTYYYTVLIQIPEEKFKAARSEEFNEYSQRQESIKLYFDKALDSYKNNKDILAITDLLSALELSLDGGIMPPEMSKEAIADKIIEYLENLEIVQKKNGRNVPADSVTIEMKRNKGLFSPVVEEATILIEYATSYGREESVLTHLGQTDSDGKYIFSLTNSHMVRSSILTFSPYLDTTLLKRISEKGAEDIVKRIEDKLYEKRVSIPIKLDSKARDNALVVFSSSYENEDIANDEIVSIFNQYFALSSLDAPDFVFDYTEDDGETLIEAIQNRYKDKSLFFLVRVEIGAKERVRDLFFSKAEASVIVFDKSSEKVKEIAPLNSVGKGATIEEANEDAYLKLLEIIFGLIESEF